VSRALQNFNSPLQKFFVETGTESSNPIIPTNNTDVTKLSIAILDIPPFTVSSFEVGVIYNNNRRFTMNDIGKIGELAVKLEKAVKLQSLEIQSIKSIVTGDDGAALLKSGIFVENFSSLDNSEILSGYFGVSIVSSTGECFPAAAVYGAEFELVNVDTIAISDDIITMPYEVELLVSQVNANGRVNVNPGAINDSRGRATINKRNSWFVNLLTAGLLYVASNVAYKTIGAYLGGTLGSLFTGDTLSVLNNIAGFNSDGLLAIAWRATRDIGLDFLKAIDGIDGISSLSKAFGSLFKAGPDSIVTYLTKGISSLIPDATRTLFSNFGDTFLSELTGMGNILGNIFNQSPIYTITELYKSITGLSSFTAKNSFVGLTQIANAISQGITSVPIIGPAIQQAALYITESVAGTWLAAYAPTLAAYAPIAIAAAGVYLVVEYGGQILEGIGNAVTDVVNFVGDTINDIGDGLAELGGWD
jgi:hypothetical protein